MPKSKEAYMFWTHAAIGVAVDVALLVVPIVLVYKKMMFSRRSIKVMIVLSVGKSISLCEQNQTNRRRHLCHRNGHNTSYYYC